MSTTIATPPPASSPPPKPHENYLNAHYGIRSWLLTTDHKRIALLWLASVTCFFALGGFFAMLIRLQLLTPEGWLVTPDTYNRLFTMHGVMMIFFFLIPSIPAVLGNFLIPLMIGAKDLAFPKLNLLSWYIFNIGALFTVYSIVTGVWIPAGRSTRRTAVFIPTPKFRPRSSEYLSSGLAQSSPASISS